MARFRYIPHDQDREDQKAEEKAERRAMRNAPCVLDPEPDSRFGFLDPQDDEFESVDSFAEYLYDEEREQYNHHELQCVWFRTGLRIQQVREALEGYGLTLARREKPRTVRGFTSNPHNRYSGNPMGGGGGGGSIYGMVD